MLEPVQGGKPTGRTRVRVLADRRVLVIRPRVRRPGSSGHRQLYEAARRGDEQRGPRRDFSRDVSRRPLRLRVLGESRRRPLRRAHQPRERRHEQQLGRHLGSRDQADRQGLECRDPHPGAHALVQEGVDQLAVQRAAPRSAPAGIRAVGQPAAGLQGHADEPRRSPDGPARVRTGDRPVGSAGRRGRRRRSQPGRASGERQPRQPRRDAAAGSEPPGLGFDQHRLCRDRGRHAADESHALQPLLSREAHLLPGRRRHLPVWPGARDGHRAVLQPANRARGR